MLRELRGKEYREGYVEGHVRGGIAHQIRALREARGWSQGELARRAGKPQSVINRLENPEYGKFSISTLLELASTFDVALMVRFVSFGEMVNRYSDLSPDALNVTSFGNDMSFADLTISTEPFSVRPFRVVTISYPMASADGSSETLSSMWSDPKKHRVRPSSPHHKVSETIQ